MARHLLSSPPVSLLSTEIVQRCSLGRRNVTSSSCFGSALSTQSKYHIHLGVLLAAMITILFSTCLVTAEQ
eukprot:scaffold6374_cov121-Cylindrotheca_fusiformis.AAC.9